jgi:tRNA threonylcarbamoyladenosine biosynthesis protein TsaB
VRLLAGASEPMERGHQERLAPMAAEVMAEAGLAFADLGKLAVTIGPGSFTGLRVGLAFAKGLHLATGAPLAGIGTLAALAASGEGVRAGVIDARREVVYVQVFDDDAALMDAAALPVPEAILTLARLAPGRLRLIGNGATLLAHGLPHAIVEVRPAPNLAALGRLATAAAPEPDVRPLYLRAVDAKPMAAP